MIKETLAKNTLDKSSINSIQNILYSIMLIEKPEVLQNKLNHLQQTIKLTEVEKQIIKDIETTLDINNKVDANYIKNKFEYYFGLVPEREIDFDQIDYAILDVQARQARTNLSAELMKLASDVEGLTSLDLKEKLREISQKNTLLTTKEEKEIENGFRPLDDPYKTLTENKGEFSLYLPEVNEATGLMARGHLVSILGFTGSFKTTYALNIAYENAMKGYNILYLSLESTSMSLANKIVLKHIATTAEKRTELIDGKELRDGKLKPSQVKHYNDKYNEIASKISNNLIMLDNLEFSYDTFAEMDITLKKIDNNFKKNTGKGLDMIILDQLSLLKYTRGSGEKVTYDGARMNEWMIYFQKQALNFLGEDERRIGVIVLAQIRREAYQEASKQKNKGRYDASAASDSSEIERTSDTMITLYKDLDVRNTLLVHTPKARHGAVFNEPLQVEVYGEYSHIGVMDNLDGEQITVENFEKSDFSLENLLK